MIRLLSIAIAISLIFSGVFIFLVSKERCNVAVVKINGNLTTDTEGYITEGDNTVFAVSSDRLVKEINTAKNKSYIKALILDIDSNGGSVVAAEEIVQALNNVNIPTVALVRNTAFSAAYTITSAAQKIFIGKSSQVGSIGVTASYLAQYEKNLKEGLIFEEITSAKYKDILNPNKPLSLEEKALIESIVDQMHSNVVEIIARGRKVDSSIIEAIADGSIFVGEQAIEKGLADRIGYLEEVRDYLGENIGKKIKVCGID